MIIKYFSNTKEHNLIVKPLKGTVFSEILMDFITRNKFQNIDCQDSKLNQVLEKCDSAIIDYPSSSIIEANKANIPTLVLSYSALRIRENAIQEYKNIEVFRYNNRQEIINNISEFVMVNS